MQSVMPGMLVAGLVLWQNLFEAAQTDRELTSSDYKIGGPLHRRKVIDRIWHRVYGIGFRQGMYTPPLPAAHRPPPPTPSALACLVDGFITYVKSSNFDWLSTSSKLPRLPGIACQHAHTAGVKGLAERVGKGDTKS